MDFYSFCGPLFIILRIKYSHMPDLLNLQGKIRDGRIFVLNGTAFSKCIFFTNIYRLLLLI